MRQHVLTLAAAERLSERMVEAAGEEMRRREASVDAPRWLARGSACDLCFDGVSPAVIEAGVRHALAGSAVDLAAQPVAGRRKRLLVADLESTVIRNEMLDEMAELAGNRDEVAEITSRAMAGELDFAQAVRQRVGALAGLPAEAVERLLDHLDIDPGAATLVATMASHGAYTALVSGGFGLFAEPVRHRLRFDAYRANELLISNRRLTGRVAEPILGPDSKLRALEDYCRRLAIRPRDAVAVGDGANDLPMLQAAGLGVAYHAKPAVLVASRFSVLYGDLRTLLYYQGYGEADFTGV